MYDKNGCKEIKYSVIQRIEATLHEVCKYKYHISAYAYENMIHGREAI